ncbi:DUF2971 domain-containing protein [Acinetobacter sp. 228]|uniref:hypothetical protein n=1 Tax=Acinetobacter sp. 228 TaxID=3114700 RepID=UPI003A8569AC
MEFSDRKISIFKQFFNFMRFYNINYRAKNKADENVNLDYEKTYASLVNENRIFIKELIDERSKLKESLDKIYFYLEDIDLLILREKIKKLKEKLNGYILDNKEEFECFDLRREIKLTEQELEHYEIKKKEYDLARVKIIKLQEVINFHNIMILFINLVYVDILFNKKELSHLRFLEIIDEFNYSECVALLHLSFLLESYYFKEENLLDHNYNEVGSFIRNILSLEYFSILPVVSNESLKFPRNKYVDYSVGKIRGKSEKKDYKDELRCNQYEFVNLIILQQIVLYVLNKLNVRFDSQYERKVAHYTRLDVGFNLVTKKSLMRLNSTEHMNDPSEGKILSDFFNLQKIEPENPHSHVYLTCFTFNHNSLNQFRLYGNMDDVECSGMSLVYSSDFFDDVLSSLFAFHMDEISYSKLPLFRCIYMDAFSGYFEIAKRNKFTFYQEHKNKKIASRIWESYEKKIKDIEEDINLSFEHMKVLLKRLNDTDNLNIITTVNNILKPLNYLIKHFSFQEEQECRVMKIEEISDSSVIYDNEKQRSYIEYQVDCDSKIKNIYLGEKSKINYTYLIKKIVEANCILPKVRISDNPYRSVKKDVIFN